MEQKSSDQLPHRKLSTFPNFVLPPRSLPPPVDTLETTPPTTSLAIAQDSKFHEAVMKLDSTSLLNLLMNDIEKVPYKMKKELKVIDNMKLMGLLLQQMSDKLSDSVFNVDLSNATVRSVSNHDWSSLVSSRRSEMGTVGIYFLQSKLPPVRPISSSSGNISSEHPHDIIVAKPASLEDFNRIHFISEFASSVLSIHCPSVRFVSRQDPEFATIEHSVKGLFYPFHADIYEAGGSSSPKNLFSSHAIMLMEFVKGKQLCHFTQGQRSLSDLDYEALGSLFFLDLVLRNTDRLPCRKAIPRPGVCSIANSGNPGNLMFGDQPGSLWAIDPEMQTNIYGTRREEYIKALQSIAMEIMKHEGAFPCYQALDSLFFQPLPGLSGIIDISLEELTPWNKLSEIQTQALHFILELIRLRARAGEGEIVHRAGIEPPTFDDEAAWRHWIAIASPRAILDVLKFVEVHTGYSSPSGAAAAFRRGFKSSLKKATQFERKCLGASHAPSSDLQSVFATSVLHSHDMAEAIKQDVDVSFVMEVIESIKAYDVQTHFQRMVKVSHLLKNTARAISHACDK